MEKGTGAAIAHRLNQLGSFFVISSTCVTWPAWQQAPIAPSLGIVIYPGAQASKITAVVRDAVADGNSGWRSRKAQ